MSQILDQVKRKLRKASQERGQKNIAVFVDGPNILRKEFDIDLTDIVGVLKAYGKIKIGRVFLNQYAHKKLVEAVVNQGFESVVTVGDIDVSMAADAVETIFNDDIHALAFVTRDSDFLPAITKAKRYGKDTIVIMAEESGADSLKNNADHVIVLK